MPRKRLSGEPKRPPTKREPQKRDPLQEQSQQHHPQKHEAQNRDSPRQLLLAVLELIIAAVIAYHLIDRVLARH